MSPLKFDCSNLKRNHSVLALSSKDLPSLARVVCSHFSHIFHEETSQDDRLPLKATASLNMKLMSLTDPTCQSDKSLLKEGSS